MRRPTPSGLADKDVPRANDWLAGRHIALVVTGGIAAMKAPSLARAFRRWGADVTAFVSKAGLRFVTEDALAWATTRPVVTELSAMAEHVAGTFDAVVVAPATYNVLNKVRFGIADDMCSTLLAVALGRCESGRQALLFAPTMHGDFHNSVLDESLNFLEERGAVLIPPRDDYGKHNLPDAPTVLFAVARALSTSPLRGQRVLVTGGPTPVPIDGVRRITNRFRGRLGILIAEELNRRGADVRLVHGASGVVPPATLSHRIVHTYDAYRAAVLEELQAHPTRFGVFSAAVADYAPAQAEPGKIPSGRPELVLRLTPTAKVIDEVRRAFPLLGMVSFKYQEDMALEDLLAIAQTRADRGHLAVIANRGAEMSTSGAHQAWLVRSGAQPRVLVDRAAIATAVADVLSEQVLREAPGVP